MITLVLGGARSGKSEIAERLVGGFGLDVTYVATGAASDKSMIRRIEIHQQRRPSSWKTIELFNSTDSTDSTDSSDSSSALPEVLRAIEGPVIIDSLGTWLARFSGFDADVGSLCSALLERTGSTVVVSEEVGMGVHPSTEIGRDFRDALGAVNRQVALISDEVLLVVAGRALRLEQFD